jgi:two-component system, cell cycle sensor histidine kinase PleC
MRVGTEVIIALPPERVMAALAPMNVPSPALHAKEPPAPIDAHRTAAAASGRSA